MNVTPKKKRLQLENIFVSNVMLLLMREFHSSIRLAVCQSSFNAVIHNYCVSNYEYRASHTIPIISTARHVALN